MPVPTPLSSSSPLVLSAVSDRVRFLLLAARLDAAAERLRSEHVTGSVLVSASPALVSEFSAFCAKGVPASFPDLTSLLLAPVPGLPSGLWEVSVELPSAVGRLERAQMLVLDLPLEDPLFYAAACARAEVLGSPFDAFAGLFGWSPGSERYQVASRLVRDGVSLYAAFVAAQDLVS